MFFLQLTFRGKTIANKARICQAKGSSDLLDNAKKWGMKVVHIDRKYPGLKLMECTGINRQL
jgi:hypothetical protein